jgi:signal transduction histidine kinase
MEAILAEWEAFAASLTPGASGMTRLALRDHAQQILEAIATDLSTSQTRAEQSEKSKGRASSIPDAPETAAQTHAVLRAASGFDINHLVAEYRALRASVLRLWIDACEPAGPPVEDMIRFNEAIDQAIAESVGHFHREVERARNLLLGTLGHDMQSPLTAIQLTAKYLTRLNVGENVSAAADRLIRSGAAMQALLDDLVDFNRTRLGLGFNVMPKPVDLGLVVEDELEQLRGAFPDRRIEFSRDGDLRGEWDPVRLQQLLRNLVSNAVWYGSTDTPIRVALRGEDAEVWLEVTNDGPTIDAESLARIFEPLQRGVGLDDSRHANAGLGLGLFIVREVAHAHGGAVSARSAAGRTTFAVRLPRAGVRRPAH